MEKKIQAVKLINKSKSKQDAIQNIKVCDSFIEKGLGLMFRKNLAPNAGILLADKHESRLNAGIHMLFMNFDITVLWLDKGLKVVDKALAKKWRPLYLPDKPAQYVVELHQTQFDYYAVGDQLLLES